MPLASEKEWETDPELREMRREFVASFETRRQGILVALPALRAGPGGGREGAAGEDEAAWTRIVEIAHKLSGAAETYGFPTLTRASGAIEDWTDATVGSGRDARLCVRFAELLASMLEGTRALGKDDARYAKDERFVELMELGRLARRAD